MNPTTKNGDRKSKACAKGWNSYHGGRLHNGRWCSGGHSLRDCSLHGGSHVRSNGRNSGGGSRNHRSMDDSTNDGIPTMNIRNKDRPSKSSGKVCPSQSSNMASGNDIRSSSTSCDTMARRYIHRNTLCRR